VQEADFLARLDAEGILRPGAIEAPPRSSAFTVFAQRTDARVEFDVWRRHGAQFFEAELEQAVPKHYRFDPPSSDAARIILSSAALPKAACLCFGRPRTDDDLRAADFADVRAGSAGMGKLAERCKTVWLVTAAGEEATERYTLLLAAILASVVLGPILSPDGSELFGVRTARLKLEESGRPYR
jgi:hypothetical protein